MPYPGPLFGFHPEKGAVRLVINLVKRGKSTNLRIRASEVSGEWLREVKTKTWLNRMIRITSLKGLSALYKKTIIWNYKNNTSG